MQHVCLSLHLPLLLVLPVLLPICALASPDHATTLQVPSTKTAGFPMVDATCNVWRCWMHASTAIKLNPQILACATLHAKSWRGACLSAACARCRARKGRGVQPQPLLVVAGLMLAAAWPGSKICLNHLFQNIGRRAVKGWGVQPQPLLPAVLKWALAQKSWASCLQNRHVW